MADSLLYAGLRRKQPNVVFVRREQTRVLQRGHATIVNLALQEITRITKRLVNSASREEFVELRNKAFPDYINLCLIIANTFELPADPSVRFLAIRESFHILQQVFGHEVAARLGQETGQEAAFCLATLSRAYRLLERLVSRQSVPTAQDAELDQKLSNNFNSAAAWTQIHLGCLQLIVKQQSGVNKEVLAEVMQGLRAAVTAYCYVRHGLELRTAHEPYLPITERDEEDKELLDESFDEYQSNIDAES
jgi:hypothetical protein